MGDLISINQFIWHFCAFATFAWVLYKLAWKPILGTIDSRKDAIETSFADIEKKQAEVAALQEKYELKLREIQEETTRRIQDAIKHGEDLAQKIRSDAEAARDKILEKARADIDRERAIASAELRNQVVELSILVSEKLLKDPSVVNIDVHRRLLERYLSEVEGVR